MNVPMLVHRSLATVSVLALASLLAAAVPLHASGEAGEASPVASPAVAGSVTTPGTVPGSALVPASAVAPAPALVDLVNPDGSTFDLASLTGAPTLLFFGYTHCPDVCPVTIGEILGVFEAEPEAQAVFVSVDPERDTPEFMASWSQYLPERFHAVTGSAGAIRRAADEYGVRYARVDTGSTSGYTMSHTADVFLVDGHGQLVGTFPFGTSADTMAADIAALGGGTG
jgi:protein SCO1/2